MNEHGNTISDIIAFLSVCTCSYVAIKFMIYYLCVIYSSFFNGERETLYFSKGCRDYITRLKNAG